MLHALRMAGIMFTTMLLLVTRLILRLVVAQTVIIQQLAQVVMPLYHL